MRVCVRVWNWARSSPSHSEQVSHTNKESVCVKVCMQLCVYLRVYVRVYVYVCAPVCVSAAGSRVQLLPDEWLV